MELINNDGIKLLLIGYCGGVESRGFDSINRVLMINVLLSVN